MKSIALTILILVFPLAALAAEKPDEAEKRPIRRPPTAFPSPITTPNHPIRHGWRPSSNSTGILVPRSWPGPGWE